MNTISKTHKRFSERLRNPRVLEYPEEFLGENYEAVLNFWLSLDELSEEQIKVVNEPYEAFFRETCSEYYKATDLANDTSIEVVGVDYAYDADYAAYDVTKSWAACWATRELIGLHKILEDHQKPLTFFEMILEVL
jgi:hypothetical protein